MEQDLSRFKDVFFEEAAEHIAAMETALLKLEAAPSDREQMNAVFRAVHSIKGSGGMFGLDGIVRFAHAFESLMEELRNGDRSIDGELAGLLLRSADVLKALVANARTGSAPPEEAEQVRSALEGARSAPAPAAAAAEPAPSEPEKRRSYRLRFEPSRDLFRTAMDPLLVLRDLTNLGTVEEVEIDRGRLPELAAMDPETCYLGWRLKLTTAAGLDGIRDVFAFVEDDARIEIEPEEQEPEARPAAPAPPPQTPPPPAGGKAPEPARAASHPAPVLESSTVRVATAKVDKLVDLVGEVVIAQSVAGQILSGFSMARLGELLAAFSELERNTRELQERVMAVRMQPIGGVFSRFPRLVRDLASATGKRVALTISGEDTELDKGVIEQLADPLTHLVRNAVDHGIESPEQRRQAGKPEQGVVRLEAFHEEGSVMVEVSDDGRGLDVERIRAKAVERELIGPDELLDEDEVRSLIFRPGFSTAESVSDISGRGVGMDVVRRNVEALNGVIAVSSDPGRGSRFRIRLPLTVAILDGQLLKIGAETYVLPLVAIRESIRPRAAQLKQVAGKGEAVLVRGRPLPLIRLHAVLGLEGAVTDAASGAVVVVEYEGRGLALLVDELLGQQPVVIKSLESHFRKVEGVMGATILGDGRAAFILDVAGIAHLTGRRPGERILETV